MRWAIVYEKKKGTIMCGVWYWSGMPLWGLPLVGLVPLTIFSLLAYGIYRLFSLYRLQAGTPMEILDKRYAQGKVTANEYQRIKAELQ